MSAVAEIALFPLDKGESVSRHVAAAVRIIMDSGLEYRVGPMGTCIEGEPEEVLDVAKKCMLSICGESERVYMVLKMDYRRKASGMIKSKVESLEKKLGEELKK
ncbi:MAG: MTH1187 family thiamine-binding protein [Spirochaetes bacterium]|jgi:uncharacterized protein (TIGR00106 family)|nr:MTH1187 family thiamine-binding protein [Spirochaetota bacterium]